MCTAANIWLVPLKPLKEAIQEFKAASNDWYLIAFAANNETRIIQSKKLNHFGAAADATWSLLWDPKS